ncbi:hypothetical protein LTR17_019033 [Elasticomyces elasticus]|nr:hypothetical protein LTR17_019033 [Elasticomyces elasticus]
MADQIDKSDAYALMTSALKSMHQNSKYSDLTVKCGGQEWAVHKAIVCLQSPFFEKHCDEGWMQGEEDVTPLPDDDPHVVDAMIRYFYTFDYSDEDHVKPEDLEGIPSIVLDVLVHMIADKNAIPSLEKLAASKFEQRAKAEWETKAFADAATLIYTQAAHRGDQLKETVMSVATEHADTLSDPASPSGAHFRSAVEAVPALGVAVWRRYVEHVEAEKSKPKYYRCPNCAISVAEDKIITGTGGTTICTGCNTNYYVKDWLARPV